MRWPFDSGFAAAEVLVRARTKNRKKKTGKKMLLQAAALGGGSVLALGGCHSNPHLLGRPAEDGGQVVRDGGADAGPETDGGHPIGALALDGGPVGRTPADGGSH